MPKCEICRNPRFAFAAVFAIFLTFATGAFDQAQAAFDITEDFSAMTVPVNGQNTDWGTVWQGANSSEGLNAWCGWNDNSPSNSSGTDTSGGGAGGIGDNFVYLEGSGATAAPTNCSKAISSPSDNYFQTINQYDAGAQKIYMTYDYNPNFDGILYVEYQVNGAGAWIQVGTPPTSNLSDQWLSSSTYDFDAAGANTGNIRIRFRLTTAGSAFANDGGLDNIRIWGVDRDTTPPSAAGSLAVSSESGGFVPDSFTVTEDFSDGESAISGCEYNLGSGWSPATWSAPTCTGNVSGQTDGAALTIEMRATSLGGTGASASLNHTVDVAAPSTGDDAPGGTITYEPTITLTAADGSGSGVASIDYCIDETNTCVPGTAYTAPFVVSGTPGAVVTKYIRYASTDNLGNAEAVNATAQTIDLTCIDPDVATLTTSAPDPAGGTVTVQVQVGGEGAPDAMANMAVSIPSGAGGTPVSGAPLSWNTGSGRWEYSWNTASTHPNSTSAAEAGVTINVSGDDPDCGDAVNASQVTVTVNNVATTAAGTATAVQGTPSSIGVTMPYGDDANGTSTYTVDYKLSSAGTWTNWVTSAANTASPYVAAIFGLTTGATYDVRVTYLDATDGLSNPGVAVQTVSNITLDSWVDSPLLHNSLRFADGVAEKWSGDWGTPTGQYGGFTCATCHARGSGNVKQIVAAISAPNTGTQDFPGGAGAPVALTDVRDGSSDFGDDAGGHATSTRICEVCHSQTSYHRYDTAGQTGGSAHYNQTDCMKCHPHSQGFKAACDACHGSPPTVSTLGGPDGLANDPVVTGSASAGRHIAHVTDPGGPQYNCNSCHFGWEASGQMPNSGNLNIGFTAFGQTGGTYNGRTGGGGYTDGTGMTINLDDSLTCANYCHGSTLGGSAIADWDDGTGAACGDCHTAANATVDTLPSGTSHNTHAKVQNQPCVNCHGAGYTSGTATPTGHVDGSVRYDVSALDSGKRFDGAVAVTYRGVSSGQATGSIAPSGTYGTCTNVNCHYGNTTPAWDGSLGAYPARCVACHNDGTAGTALINSAPDNGVHREHLDGDALDSSFVSGQCDDCHGAGASTAGHSGHGDPDSAVVIGGEISSYPGDGSCINTCHATDATTTVWAAAGSIQCDDCHRAGYIGPVVVDPTGTGTGLAGSGYGAHLMATTTDTIDGTTNWSTQCGQCHGYHAGAVTVALPPASWSDPSGRMSGTDMRTQLGIDYTITGGIHLGGTATAAYDNSEAEYCWGCHDSLATPVSEWGYNTKTTDAGFPVVQLTTTDDGTAETFNHGWIYTDNTGTTKTSDWTTGYWIDQYRSMLKRPVSSVHSANLEPAGQTSSVGNVDSSGRMPWFAGYNGTDAGVEAKNEIRCSYCHDVHNLNKAVGDTASDAPFLRGSWMGNPYPADTPPLSTDTYPITGGPTKPQCDNEGSRFTPNWTGTGTAPRLWGFSGDDVSRAKGGFFIDQNSAKTDGTTPTQGKTVAGTAGLCTLCHGTDVDTMDFYPANTLWRSIQTNGHANSTLGGTGSGRVKIFDATRGGATYQMAMQNHLGRGQWELGWGFGNLNPKPACGTADIAPIYVTGWYGAGIGDRSGTSSTDGWSDWYGASQVAKPNYHKFSCSKCHSPHAAGLPALLTTNCLDASLSTWQGTTDGADPSSSAANNCHRNDSADGDGWNRLAPGQND